MRRFARHRPGRVVSGGTLYEQLIARLSLLPVRFRASSVGLAPGLLSTLPDLSGGSGPATAAGSLRPTVVGDEIVFAGAQRMVTPAFTMGARSSGLLVARFTAIGQGAFQFSVLNTHTSVLCQNTGGGDQLKVRSSPVGDAGVPVAFPRRTALAWSFDASGGSVLIDGVLVPMGANGCTGATAPLSIGDLTGGIFPLIGGISELAIIDQKVSADDLALLSGAAIERRM